MGEALATDNIASIPWSKTDSTSTSASAGWAKNVLMWGKSLEESRVVPYAEICSAFT